MKNHSLFLIVVFFLLTLNYFILTFHSENGQVQSANSISKDTDVSLTVGGGYRFSVFGYTSPQALVTIEGTSIYDQTYADNKGYFEFVNRFSPYLPRETCINSQDQFGRISQPACLPPFKTNYNVMIGPVIIPPTISLDKNNYYIGEEVVLSGQTIPNSEINLSIFTKNVSGLGSQIPNLTLVKPAEAFTFPVLQAKSDKQGNFSVSLPSSQSKDFRLFAQTLYTKSPSPQSTALNLRILPVWMMIFKIFWLIFNLIKPRLFEVAIVIELILLILYISHRYFHPRIIALALRDNLALSKT